MAQPLTLIIQTSLFERRLALIQNRTPVEFRIDPDYPILGPYSPSSRLLYRPTTLHVVRIMKVSTHGSTALVELADKTQGRLILGQTASLAQEGQLMLAQVVRGLEPSSGDIPQKGPVLSTQLMGLQGSPLPPQELEALTSGRSSPYEKPTCVWSGWSFLERYLYDYKDEIQKVIVDSPSLKEEVSTLSAGWKQTPKIELFSPRQQRSSLFESFALEDLWDTLDNPIIPLPQGGSLILEKTHAGWIYDLNKPLTHRSSLITNTQAGTILIKDIRLKNLSGLIVADFLPVKSQKNKEVLLHKMRQEAQTNPCPPHIHAISSLGLLEITRLKRDLSVLEDLLILPSKALESPPAHEKKILRALEHRLQSHPKKTAFDLSLSPSCSTSFLETLETMKKSHGIAVNLSPEP